MLSSHRARRSIIHVDMDAFYASVEQRDDPDLRGRPVIVGGGPESRGVVASCSYEARTYGIHSAMSSKRAYRLCPDAVFVPPRFLVYKEVSDRIMDIFREFTDRVEPMSLDEAYLDVTHTRAGIDDPVTIARKIREEIRKRTGLSASAGVSYNKFLAKIASDFNKPDGLKVINPWDAQALIDDLPVRKFHGIGRVTAERMIGMGILRGRDLRRYDIDTMGELFGKAGKYYYDISRGIDDREVAVHHSRRSMGKERTLKEDTDDPKRMHLILDQIASDLAESLQRGSVLGRTVTLKVKYSDFSIITRSMSNRVHVNDRESIMNSVRIMMREIEIGRPVRLLGIQISNLSEERGVEGFGQATLDQFIIPPV
ncbi:MAG: DNA polymerase IV [Thermoplasmatota archaeon]